MSAPKEVYEFLSQYDPLDFKNRNAPRDTCEHTEEYSCFDCNPKHFKPSRVESSRHASIALGKRLIEAKRRYYKGLSTITDAEYDALEDTLRVIDPNNPVLSLVGLIVDVDLPEGEDN